MELAEGSDVPADLCRVTPAEQFGANPGVQTTVFLICHTMTTYELQTGWSGWCGRSD